MADNLPLIPDKEGTLCADVRPVLREVFRELDSLPPLQRPVAESEDCELPQQNNWAEKYVSECKEIWKREGELRDEYANRISREALPNVYKIYSPKSSKTEDPEWRRERGVVNRKDLVPTIVQNAGRDASLWIKNILNRSSGELTPIELRGTKLYQQIHLSSQIDNSLQSLSIGDVVARPAAPPPSEPQPPPQPEYVLCVPPLLDFVNFTVGQLYTQSVRLVNVSKFEIRLSLRPPRRRELDVELCGPRGLTVTSGSAADLKVHFRPRDVRDLRDVLHVRVSIGKSFAVPIACYMQPPLLDISVPSVSGAVLSCSPGDGSRCEATSRSSDVLELGARLLGEVHSGLTSDGSVVCDGFALCPAWWRGGGAVRGCAWCLAPCAGLHSTTFRLLCSTAVVRPLNLIADSLLFSPDHLTIQAQEKDYDICSEDDPGCEYYVNLGTAFPRRPLSATVQLLNRSPITYSYYWSVRPWGVCSCWAEEWDLDGAFGPEDDDERLCVGAMAAKKMAEKGMSDSAMDEEARAVRVEAVRGQLAPRSSRVTHVRVPDVGRALGVHRAVLMLILKDIPKESFPPNYDPMVVRTKIVEAEAIPGMQVGPREVCEVVCCQLEVWWEVAPVRFALDPCVIPLFHSRRVQSVNVALRATQLFGCEPIDAQWRLPHKIPPIGPSRLAPSHSCPVSLHIPLPSLPNDYPAADVITLSDVNGEWESRCLVRRQCATRYPALRPARLWLGVVHPGDHLHTTIDVINDTHQEICWWTEGFRWWGENVPSPACIGRPPCEACQERICSCALLKPTRGTLKHGDATIIHYDVNAPDRDGCVATLVQVRRTGADVARVPAGAGTTTRATLVAHRVLAPVLVMRVLPCGGGSTGCCDDGASADGCTLDQGALGSERGTATLRPLGALALGRRTCYRLRFTNLTPLPTSVHWDTPIDNKEFLLVMFLPSHFQVKSYGEVETRVVLEARKVCGRRAFVYRAQVAKAHRPLYLLVDAAIAVSIIALLHHY
ncbi:hypothetical protein K1T71_008068 [Dendrolimus kikuchii]|uniref:Uncharacterized protein n=1 Tax=Dendrolimus kikuchii TaxID=765133 RepID=A0ACC1CZJ0_9NEOP|nr:hypothetical protein K1T71_008068 [Dendrolimus kikuchii]